MKIALCILMVLFAVALLIVGGIAWYVFSLNFHETLKLLYYLEHGDEDK